MSSSPLPRVDRRTAIKWMLTAASTAALFGLSGRADNQSGPARARAAQGYGTDPDLQKEYHPGDLWPLTFTPAQRAAAAALCAVIIPRDERSPSAADLGVHDFIDEWISAPYPVQTADRPLVLAGLDWLEGGARQQFGHEFAVLTEVQKTALCDALPEAPATPGLPQPAAFFTRFRELTASGFYTTPEGMKDIGYVGNTPLAEFAGPPLEVRQKLGLA